MRTTAKRNPITGDPVNNSSFPGSTGSEREKIKNAAGTLTRKQNKAINQGVDKQTGKIQYKGIPTKGELRREERRRIKEGKKFDTNYRQAAKSGNRGANNGGKKGQIVKPGLGGLAPQKKRNMHKSCRSLHKN